MGICDTFHFDAEAYQRKVQRTQNINTLCKKHYEKTRSIMSSSVALGAGAGVAVATAGLTAITCVYSLRQVHVLETQQNIIAAEILNRGYQVPEWRKRDILSGLTFGALEFTLFPVAP